MKIPSRLLLFFLLSLTICFPSFSQKVGLVLSGGGSSGLAHIGVLKALEENHIPVDYITGTSIGSFVGAMYSMGYTPKQIEDLAVSEEFHNWVYGDIEKKYIYYFKKKDDDASWFKMKISLDSALENNLPTNLISPTPLDFALMEKTAAASAAANYNFDSLFIPFRCVAADIESKLSVVFKDGDLGEAIRASVSYPFYLKPIKINGKLLFDGGIYNNFPSDIMYEQCFPDIIIGSNVSGNIPSPNEDNLISQLKTMLINRSYFDIQCPNGIIISPHADIATFDFSNPQALIDSGYTATIRQMDVIKERVTRRTDSLSLAQKRQAFKQKEPPLVFGDIHIEGLSKRQTVYIKKILRKRENPLSIKNLKPAYFRVVEDDKIKQIYPKAKYDLENRNYDLFLGIKREKALVARLGGNVSNRPISEIFAGLEYKYLDKIGISTMANAYFGKLYSSAKAAIRLDFPFIVPFYLEPELTFNRWDFFRSSNNLFFEDVKTAYLIQNEQHSIMNLAFPLTHKNKIVIGAGWANTYDKYYQTTLFTSKDTPDVTSFDMVIAHLLFEQNTLNRKQYATQGTYIGLKIHAIQGEEYTVPGSTSELSSSRRLHQWVQIKFTLDNYYKQRGTLRMGIFAEGVFSDQPLFNNYTASVLASPAFQPLAESKTLFQPNLRAHTYAAFGLKNIITIKNRFDLRLEGYIFQPYLVIQKGFNNVPYYSVPFLKRYLIGSGSLVGHTPIGPISFAINYYFQEKQPFTFLFHFGYIIFNKKATD